MRIVLDRRNCNCWDPACEAHFGWHFLRGEITPVDCTVDVIEDGKPERVFYIQDRDGVDRVLIVNDDNWALAHDSWRIAWEQQAGI